MVSAERASTHLRPYTLTFDDERVELDFRSELRQRTARSARLAITAGVPGYLLMLVVLDDADARWIVLAMVGVLAAWLGLAWTRWYERAFEPITIGAVAILAVLSFALFLELPAPSAVVLMVAYATLNFIWIFVFLRLRFPYALALGVGFFGVSGVIGPIVWDRFGSGGAPEGMIDPLGGAVGGVLLVWLYAGFLLTLCASIGYRLEKGERVDYLLRRELADAYEQSERLLTNVLPVPVAERLKFGESPIADECAEVSVVFADIADFTKMSDAMEPAEILELLNEVFSRFDRLADVHGLEKIKTVGDSYMAVAGVPMPMADHARAAAQMALDMVDAIAVVRRPDGTPLRVRIGIGSGPAMAGVIGTSKFIYDLWGDTVNTASRMESHGVVGRIQVSEATRLLLDEDAFVFEDRGPVQVKGKGSMRTWFLVDRRDTS
jgi:class 3 adenylate cyclase